MLYHRGLFSCMMIAMPIQFLWSDAHDTGIYPYSSLINFALNDEQAKCNNNKKLLEFVKSFAEEN